MADLLLWKKKHLELNFEFPNCPMISVAINNDNTVQNISGAPSQRSSVRLQKALRIWRDGGGGGNILSKYVWPS